MNRSLLGRIAPFLFAFYAIGLLAFAAYALLTFSPSAFLPTLRWEYALKRGFVLFMDYLVPLHAAAIAIAASMAGFARTPRAPGAPARPFNKVVSSAGATFLVLAAGYTVLFEGVYPGVMRRLSDMQNEVVGDLGTDRVAGDGIDAQACHQISRAAARADHGVVLRPGPFEGKAHGRGVDGIIEQRRQRSLPRIERFVRARDRDFV